MEKKIITGIGKFLIWLLSIIIFSFQTYAGHVDTLHIYSPSMGKKIPTLVLLPDNYFSDSTKYPAIYLLHGLGGNYQSWLNNVPELASFCDRYQVIQICPDGDNDSWYFDIPNQSRYYETFIGKEIVEHIDQNYRTIPTKKFRAIAGLSMGGQAALRIAINNKNTFGSSGSISGVVNLNASINKVNILKLFGLKQDNKDYLDSLSVDHMIDSLKIAGLNIIIDCGTDDYLYNSNLKFHHSLLHNGIPHSFLTRQGKHEWKYFSEGYYYQMEFFHKFFIEP